MCVLEHFESRKRSDTKSRTVLLNKSRLDMKHLRPCFPLFGPIWHVWTRLAMSDACVRGSDNHKFRNRRKNGPAPAPKGSTSAPRVAGGYSSSTAVDPAGTNTCLMCSESPFFRGNSPPERFSNTFPGNGKSIRNMWPTAFRDTPGVRHQLECRLPFRKPVAGFLLDGTSRHLADILSTSVVASMSLVRP